jgi:peptidoglycan hydrolase CwlO-like protein
MILSVLVTVLTALTVAAPARASELQRDRRQARELARQIGALDAGIEQAVRAYAQATAGLDAVRAEIRANLRARRIARLELDIAKGTLLRRAVALYKRGDVTQLDALFNAADFQQLVDHLSLVKRVNRSDGDVLRAVLSSRRELQRRSMLLAADERTAERLVRERSRELGRIRTELRQRRRLLAGVRADIARLAARQVKADPSPRPTVEPPSTEQAGGQGAWWPLIKTAAAAQGVSARGMYRLMMIESGGSATAVGPGGYHGLFQYSPGTWKGSWNPYRSAGIYDGSAQIRATALAISQGHGPSWWGSSFGWAFGS